MNPKRIVQEIFFDLKLISSSKPNERLPKEEQIRCCLYSKFRSDFDVLCAERGYGSIDDLSRIECDLWGCKKGSPDVWLEFKRCWAAKKGWNNKPTEQLYSWQADISKLQELPPVSDRYFLLIGFFDIDPQQKDKKSTYPILNNIRNFYPSKLKHFDSQPFSWRKENNITHIAAWVWLWKSGQLITFKV